MSTFGEVDMPEIGNAEEDMGVVVNTLSKGKNSNT